MPGRLLTEAQLEHALAVQDSTGRPLGEVIVTLGYASAGAVANALAEQYSGTLKTEYGVSAGLGGPRKAERPRETEEHALVVGGRFVPRGGACPDEGSVIEDAQGRRFLVKRVGLVRRAYLEPAPQASLPRLP